MKALTKHREDALRYLMTMFRREHFMGGGCTVKREDAYEFAQAVAAALYDLGLVDDRIANCYGIIVGAKENGVDCTDTGGANT